MHVREAEFVLSELPHYLQHLTETLWEQDWDTTGADLHDSTMGRVECLKTSQSQRSNRWWSNVSLSQTSQGVESQAPTLTWDYFLIPATYSFTVGSLNSTVFIIMQLYCTQSVCLCVYACVKKVDVCTGVERCIQTHIVHIHNKTVHSPITNYLWKEYYVVFSCLQTASEVLYIIVAQKQ